MTPPPLPPDEADRIQELENLYLLDTPAEERFDRLTRLALKVFDVPITAITLIDRDRSWFKSVQGLSVLESVRDLSFCGHAILTSEPLIVPDTLEDDRFRDNPFVVGDPHIRFYAGCPLSGPKGHHLGVFCVMDRKPRTFSDTDLENLRLMAALAREQLGITRIDQIYHRLLREQGELRTQALVDSLTRLWNRAAILEVLELELRRSAGSGEPVGVAMADLDHFKEINDTHGHPAGDVALLETARRIRSCLRPTDTAGRMGGEEFLIVLPGVDAPRALEIVERIRLAMAGDMILTPQAALSVTLSLGVGVTPKSGRISCESILSQVDKALYTAKNAGRNCVRQCVLE